MNKVTLATSSEYLRLALPMMSRYGIPVTPPNYAVWYEYASGSNAALKQAIDDLINSDATIDQAVTSKLHRQFVDTRDLERLQEAQHTLRTIADTLSHSLETASGEVTRYEQSLVACSSQLADDMSAEQIQTLVSDLAASTRQMTAGSADLQHSLEESRRETLALRQELERARAEAKTDALTGLANRKAFDERLEQLAASNESSGKHCLLIADIDKFKSVNDSYGHLLGDRVIKTVARALQQVIKGKDLAARFGGEEFVVLLPDTPLAGAGAVAESIRQTIERGRILNQRTGEEIRKVTISIGVTQLAPGEPIADTLARADEALYRAKANGRNRVEIAAVRDRSAASVDAVPA
jgi:diguanylate cyclase